MAWLPACPPDRPGARELYQTVDQRYKGGTIYA